MVACVAAVIYFFFVWNRHHLYFGGNGLMSGGKGMRREPSLWGYMMLQQDDYYPNNGYSPIYKPMPSLA